jgi:hypothetical protein
VKFYVVADGFVDEVAARTIFGGSEGIKSVYFLEKARKPTVFSFLSLIQKQ